MEFKMYYFEEENKCVICEKMETSPNFEDISNRNNIIVDLETKNVENIYDFFRDNVLKSILSGGQSLSIDFSEVENKAFYNEDSFAKLIELLNNLKDKSNSSINECIQEDEPEGDTIEIEEETAIL